MLSSIYEKDLKEPGDKEKVQKEGRRKLWGGWVRCKQRLLARFPAAQT